MAAWSRSGSGYRLYDAEAAARLDLVRTLRELGLGLDVVQAVLSRTSTVAEVAAAHVAVLDVQIRTLRLRRAVLSTIARNGHTIEETLIMSKLSQLPARERQQIIDDFVDGIFAGTDPDAPGAGIASGMRQLPADLPDDPAPEQVNAWIELCSTASWHPEPQPRSGPRSSGSSRRLPTPGWNGTGSCWPSSTTSPCRPPWSPPSSG
jgi:DNA-binding transcriptional MerR regulator